jgi:hypothetical protein
MPAVHHYTADRSSTSRSSSPLLLCPQLHLIVVTQNANQQRVRAARAELCCRCERCPSNFCSASLVSSLVCLHSQSVL